MGKVEKFYTNLYKSEGNNEHQTKENLKHIKHRLHKEESEKLNQPIEEYEIKIAIKGMKNEKSPGEDSITKEFYETYYEQLKDEMTELYNNTMLRNQQPKSQKNAIIKLLFKKGDHRI